MSDKNIIVALRYCTSEYGDFCDMCPYQKYVKLIIKKKGD